MKGDIKASTYFLQVTRSFPLQHDFYITNLFHPRKRQLLCVVIMQESVWNEINGETVTTTLELSLSCALDSSTLRLKTVLMSTRHTNSVFPHAGEILVKGQRLVIVEYELWKAKIKALQERKRERQ